MRILFFCEGYRPGTDACAKRMGVFADHLRSCGHEVAVLTSSTNLQAGGELAPEAFYCKTVPMRKKTVLRRLANNASFPASALRRAREFGPADIVIVTSPPLLTVPAARRIARAKGARLVLDLRDVWPEVAYEMGSFSEESAYARMFSKIALSAYRDADLVTTVTPGKVRKLRGIFEGEGLNTHKIQLVENGLDETFLDHEDDIDFLQRFDFEQGFTCVYAGNLGLAQGLSQLLELAKWTMTAYPDSRFLIFGKGAEESELRRVAANEFITNVEFGGSVSERQVCTALRHAKMSFVSLKSAALTSSVPTKLYESLGVGCPVLLVACGDACEVLVETELGACALPADQESIRTAYARLRAEYTSIESRKEKSRRTILNRHSRQKQAEVLERLLQDLLPQERTKN